MDCGHWVQVQVDIGFRFRWTVDIGFRYRWTVDIGFPPNLLFWLGFNLTVCHREGRDAGQVLPPVDLGRR